MKPEAYERTVKAVPSTSRATFCRSNEHVAGRNRECADARIAGLHPLSHTHREVRQLGELLKNAALSPAYNVNQESLEELVAQIRRVSRNWEPRLRKSCFGKSG